MSFQNKTYAFKTIVSKDTREIDTSEIYLDYRALCALEDLKLLSNVRFSNFISTLDMLGLINARNKSRGRYRLTRLLRQTCQRKELRVC
jgi:Cdc6-like AAA superfamily ATPase